MGQGEPDMDSTHEVHIKKTHDWFAAQPTNFQISPIWHRQDINFLHASVDNKTKIAKQWRTYAFSIEI